MNLNEVVEEMGRLLPRLIGEDIELVIRGSEDLGAIRADASQMERVIMNLAVKPETPCRRAGVCLSRRRMQNWTALITMPHSNTGSTPIILDEYQKKGLTKKHFVKD
jgi:hypothetical protein